MVSHLDEFHIVWADQKPNTDDETQENISKNIIPIEHPDVNWLTNILDNNLDSPPLSAKFYEPNIRPSTLR